MKDSGRLPQTKPCPPLKTRMIADGLREQFPARGLSSRDKQHFVSHHPRLYNVVSCALRLGAQLDLLPNSTSDIGDPLLVQE